MDRQTVRAIAAALAVFSGLGWAIMSGTVDDPDTGRQPDGTYRVVDYDSHVQMCIDMQFTAHQDECFEEARRAWR